MFYLLGITSIIYNCCVSMKDAFKKPIPAANWANEKLIHEDIMKGNSEKLFENARKGKYYMPIHTYEPPHRDPKTSCAIVENSLLYKEDVQIYGYRQAHEWFKQGRYNLTPEELIKEEARIQKRYDELYNQK